MSLRTGWERAEAPQGRAHAVGPRGTLCATPVLDVTLVDGWPPTNYGNVCSGCMQLARTYSQHPPDPSVVFQSADGSWYIGRPVTHRVETGNGDSLADSARLVLARLGLDVSDLHSDDPVTVGRFRRQAGFD
jgi:hypothetical protein